VAAPGPRGLLLGSFPEPARAQTLVDGFGVLGDSGSDEYRADDDRGGAYATTTLNWLELLVRHRSFAAGPWGTRPSPRRTGYEYNWALSHRRRRSWAFLMVGANDFAMWNDTYAHL
jgi:hypothetical protein